MYCKLQYHKEPPPTVLYYTSVYLCNFFVLKNRTSTAHSEATFTPQFTCDHSKPKHLHGYLETFSIIQNITRWNWKAFLPDPELLL